MADEPVVAPVETPAPVAPVEAKPVEQAKPAETELKAPDSILAKPVEEKKPEETKPAEKVEAPSFDPKAVKFGEGFQADEKTLGEFSTLANKLKISQEGGQELVGLYEKTVKDAAEAPYRLWHKTQEDWQKEVAADKDIGTGDLKAPLKPEVLSAVAKVIDQYGGDELRQALVFTGAGNNPAIVRAFAKMSKALTEGTHVSGQPASAPPASVAERMYPNLVKQET